MICEDNVEKIELRLPPFFCLIMSHNEYLQQMVFDAEKKKEKPKNIQCEGGVGRHIKC